MKGAIWFCGVGAHWSRFVRPCIAEKAPWEHAGIYRDFSKMARNQNRFWLAIVQSDRPISGVTWRWSSYSMAWSTTWVLGRRAVNATILNVHVHCVVAERLSVRQVIFRSSWTKPWWLRSLCLSLLQLVLVKIHQNAASCKLSGTSELIASLPKPDLH